MSEKGEIRCHECLFSADGIYNASYLCNYATLTGHCRTKIVRRKGPDGVWRKVKTVETPEECTRFLPRKGHQQRKLQREAKKPGTKCRSPRRDWDKARKLYDEGQSVARIAEALGCSKNAVYDWMDGEGLVRPSRQKGAENGTA